MTENKTKAWYDDIDAATLQRIKTYSAFNDATSKNLMMQTMYEYREKEIQDFKETNHELAETCIARKKRIAELEKENTELKEQIKELKKRLEMGNKVYNDNLDYSHHIEESLTKAKDHIKKLLGCLQQDTNDPETNYYVCKYMTEAEQFLKEVENGK